MARSGEPCAVTSVQAFGCLIARSQIGTRISKAGFSFLNKNKERR